MAKEITLPPTQKGGTVTAEGWIPHLRHPLTNVLMPVKLSLIPETTERGFAPPLRRRGYLVYVMPQGGEYLHKE